MKTTGAANGNVRIEYDTIAIGGSWVAVVEVFFSQELDDDELKAVVARMLGQLVNDRVAVVLLEGRSINFRPNTTQSFGHRISAQLALRGITLGLLNYATGSYEIHFSYHRSWPVGSIRRREVLERRRGSPSGKPVGVGAPSPVKPAAVSLEEASPKLRELNRLIDLLRRSQSAAKRRARQARVDRLRQELGMLDVA